ncbi:MAG: TlpA family protein disulfide reductase [Tidjanibacter sp.]|nr:TlpA family protein disulfide reductase [Tidjanibacter sp.]
MRLWLTLISALVVSLTAAAQDPYARVREGDRMPAFEVEMTGGERLSSESLEGKVVWICLWASWCPSCRKEFKRLASNEEFAALREHSGFVFLPIAREENSATVVAWLRKKGYDYLSAVDPERSTYELFAEQELPRNILGGPDGVVVHHSSAYSKTALGEIIDKAEKMLN